MLQKAAAAAGASPGGPKAAAGDPRAEATRRIFAENLRAACARHKSISEVCRDLGINRQQFNKYLSGASFPSAYNLARICGYLGRDTASMLSEEVEAAPLADGLALPAPSLLFGPILRQMHDANPDAARRLERHAGYYHSYYFSPAYPGRILKAVSHIYGRDGMFFDKTLERVVHGEGRAARALVHRYTGAVIHTDRIYVLHQTMVLHHTLSMVAFYPSYSATPRLLSGVFVSVSSGPGRQPFASRVVYEYHGRRPDLRRMVAACGLYPVGSPAISEDVARRLDNHIDPDDTVLRAMEY